MDTDYYSLSRRQTVDEQLQNRTRALEALKATNPDLGGARRPSPFADNVHSRKEQGSPPRKWMVPRTPQLNNQQDLLKLQRQLAQRRESYEKEQEWTKKQIEKLVNERLKLSEEEKKLEDAKKRWQVPSPPLDPILSSPSQSSDQDDLPHYQKMQQQIEVNLRKMKAEFQRDTYNEDLGRLQSLIKSSYNTTQAIQYYMARDIVMDIVNQAVDQCLDRRKPNKQRDMAKLLLIAAEKEYDAAQDVQSKERAIQLISEEIFLQVTSKMTVEAMQEWLGIEEYIRTLTQHLVINSAEAVATNNKLGRADDDPAYDLITASYFHMCKERRKKRSDVWKHTQTTHFVDPDSNDILAGVASDTDITKLDMSKLIPVHLLSRAKFTPSQKLYISREKQLWQADRFTIQPSTIRLTKKVTGVMSLAVSQTQRMLAIGTVRGDILVYDLWYDSPNPVRYIRNEGGSQDGVVSISWSLDGSRLTTLNQSRSVFMWSMHPGGTDNKDRKNLEFKDDPDEIVPSQLTLLLALDPEAEDFDFHDGPFARNQVQATFQLPSVTAFHPAHTLVGSQNSLMVGFENGDVIKCNVEQQVSETSDQFELTDNVVYPTVQSAHNVIGQDIPVELFRGHKHNVIYLGFIGNYGDMISVDSKGYIFIWSYNRRMINHYGWFEPVQKYWLEMAEEVYVTLSNESPEVYFSDDYFLEKKRMGWTDVKKKKARLERDRQEAEEEVGEVEIMQLWYMDENKKQGIETCVYRPDYVDPKGSAFHIVVRQKDTQLLLKHFSQLHKPELNHASHLLSCKSSPSGRDLVFMLLFPSSPPKPAHISFVILKMGTKVELVDLRIDINLTDEEYQFCATESVVSFDVSSALDASSSCYIYLTLLGSLLVFSLNTGILVLSSRKQDTFASIQWTPKSPTKLWARASLALACTRGTTFLMLYSETQTLVNVLQITDRNHKEKRMAVHRAFRYRNGDKKSWPVVEQTVRRYPWTLDGNPTGHVGLFATRLVLELVDRAVQKVDGEFEEADLKRFRDQDRKLAHKYFGGQLQGQRDTATANDGSPGAEDRSDDHDATDQGPAQPASPRDEDESLAV
ncbi:uncharacterized protein [Diadema antillarum]|uniref:uncharacterized protein n=1 Tax=Diadema antillarum TaxID=105358 RepID=UPI003A8C5E6C